MKVVTLTSVIVNVLLVCLSWASAYGSQDDFLVPPEVLEQEIQERAVRVAEFAFISNISKAMGVPIYLFGGSAAGLAHYVSMDLQREGGDTRYLPEHFDYEFTNIYRSDQDLDLVVDGNEDDAKKVEKILVARFPHMVGSRTAWEVRLLRDEMGDKLPLLKNKDFTNQHTDSNSVGLIELAPKGKIGDLYFWQKSPSPFVLDVARGSIRFYFSDKHESTYRFRKGKNPAILSAIRFLAKVTQYELKTNPKDLATVRKIIAETDVQNLSTYSRLKVLEFGRKALLNSPNIEMAWNLLESLGIRKIIKDVEGDEGDDDPETLTFWMSKEPLRSAPVGAGDGATAADLGLEIVAHETRSFKAFESIVKSPEGGPNVFISRRGRAHEAAVFGDGFYTKVGREGAVGTGITIRFQVDPQAREGTDFIVARDFIIFINKAALKVIRERIDLRLDEYLALLIEGEISKNDAGLQHRIRQRMNRSTEESQDLEKLSYFVDLFMEALEYRDFENYLVAIEEFMRIGVASNFPELAHKLIDGDFFGNDVLVPFFAQPGWEKHPEIIYRLLRKSLTIANRVVEKVLSRPQWVQHPDTIEYLLKVKGVNKAGIVKHIFSSPSWPPNLKWVEYVLDNEEPSEPIDQELASMMGQPRWAKHASIVDRLIQRGLVPKKVITDVLTTPLAKKNPQWIEQIIKGEEGLEELVKYVLSDPTWAHRTDWVEQLLSKGEFMYAPVVKEMLSQPDWGIHLDVASNLAVQGGSEINLFVKHVLSKPHGVAYIDFARWMVGEFETNRRFADNFMSDFVEFVLGKTHWKEYPDLVNRFFETNRTMSVGLEEHFFSKPHSTKYLKLLIQFIDTRKSPAHDLVVHVFSKDHWQKHPAFRDILLRFFGVPGISQNQDIEFLFQAYPSWKNDMGLVAALIGQNNIQSSAIDIILEETQWSRDLTVIESLLRKPMARERLGEYLFVRKNWVKHPHILDDLLSRGGFDKAIVQFILSDPNFKNTKAFLKIIFDRGMADEELAAYFFSEPHSTEFPQYLEKMMEKPWNQQEIVAYALSQRHWAHRVDLVKESVELGWVDKKIYGNLLSKPFWGHAPEIVPMILADETKGSDFEPNVFQYPHWQGRFVTDAETRELLVIKKERGSRAKKPQVPLESKSCPLGE